VDTRTAEPEGAIPVVRQRYGGDKVLRLKVTGELVPESGVGAVSLNVVAVDPSGPGFVTVYPCGPRPLAASVSYGQGQIVPGAVVAPLSSTGEICLYSHAATDLVVDLNGWFSSGSQFSALTPGRLFDTRSTDPQGAVSVVKQRYGGTGRILRVKVTGAAGVPASGVGVVSLTLTAVDPVGDGFVTAFPCGDRPLAANLNYVAGQTIGNAVLAPVSAAGEVCFYSHVDTHLVADVNGWFRT
jgi:hypothetical protein